MGGHGALYLFSQKPDLFRSAGSLSGVMDLSFSSDEYNIYQNLGIDPDKTDMNVVQSYSVMGNIERIARSGKQIIFTCGTSDPFYPLNNEFMKLCDEPGLVRPISSVREDMITITGDPPSGSISIFSRRESSVDYLTTTFTTFPHCGLSVNSRMYMPEFFGEVRSSRVVPWEMLIASFHTALPKTLVSLTVPLQGCMVEISICMEPLLLTGC